MNARINTRSKSTDFTFSEVVDLLSPPLATAPDETRLRELTLHIQSVSDISGAISRLWSELN